MTIMIQDVVEQPIVTPPHSDHKFFDLPAPEQPDQILGMNTQAILRLGHAVTQLNVLPYKANVGLRALPHAIRVFPLIEKLQLEGDLSPEDIRPYRKPIKRLHPGVTKLDMLVASTGVLAVGIPLRRALNRKVEADFPKHAANAIEVARENLALVEKEAELIASFDNPHEQFVAELTEVANKTRESIVSYHQLRLAGGIESQQEAPRPKGLAGLFTGILRKVRSFFGLIARKPPVNPNITAYDAAGGIDATIKSLLADPKDTGLKLPMLSGLLLNKLQNHTLPNFDQLAFLAPEVLTSIFSAIPTNPFDTDLLKSVINNPHELRFVTKYVNHFRKKSLQTETIEGVKVKGVTQVEGFATQLYTRKVTKHYYLDSVQRATRNLLPALRDVLPTNGRLVREALDRTKLLLQPRTEPMSPITPQPMTGRKSLKHPWDDRKQAAKKSKRTQK